MNSMAYRVWWQVYPLGFCGAPIRPQSDEERHIRPRLDKIINWLDYMEDMGCNGLLLGPIFEAETHGYDTIDYYRIDPRLGDDATFGRLVNACHERGIALMLDGVFNHVGRGFPQFQHELQRAQREFQNGEPISHANEDMFCFVRDIDGKLDYEKFEGHVILPAFNHRSAKVADLVVDVMTYWMDRGVDAWRLDAAATVPSQFWAQVLPRVRREKPDAWFMGEAIQCDYRQLVEDSTMDTVTQYELWKAVWSSLKDENFYELDWCLKRHNDFLETFVPQTFIGNHDVSRIANLVDDERKLAVAVTLLFMLGGTPSIYYGDERAWHGLKTDGIGGDDEVRPEYPQVPAELSDHGDWMYKLIGQLAAVRQAHPWMVNAVTDPVVLDNRHYVYDIRARESDVSLRVDVALDQRPHVDISMQGETEPLLHVEHIG